jgi:hypothetical protein
VGKNTAQLRATRPPREWPTSHGRPAHHLGEKGLELARPEPVVQSQGRLAGGAEADQVDPIHAPSSGRQHGGIAAPVAARRPEAMHQQQRWVAGIAQLAPVAALPPPDPVAVATPTSSPLGRLGVAAVQLISPDSSSAVHYCEGAARLQPGGGFFRPESRPSRDLGVLLARQLAEEGPLRVLDGMAGCGIRALRYGLEAGAEAVWANDADPERFPLLRANLNPLGEGACALRLSSSTAQKLLAGCLLREQRFELLDLDAFGCPVALLPLALEAVAFGGVLYLASTDGRSPTGHDRVAAIRRLGASARAHPASWELALRLQAGQRGPGGLGDGPGGGAPVQLQ